MYLEKIGTIVEKDIPKPSPSEDEVLVKLDSITVCASDTEFYEHGRIGDHVVEEPLILGHESAGIVEGVGSGVDHLEEGDRVTLEPGVPCRKCEYCKGGRYELCQDVFFFAAPPDDGVFREYVAHAADFVYKLPDSITLEEGALMEPLSVGVHAARRARVGVGDTVAVLGAGAIGLMTLQCALAEGATEVVVTDLVDFRLEVAEKLGATEVVNLSEQSIDDQSGTFDRVLQTAGNGAAYKQASELVKPGGVVAHVGFPTEQELTVNPNAIIDKEFDMVGCFRYANTYPAAISLVESGRVDVKSLLTDEFPLSEAEQALRRPREHPESTIKATVKP